MMNSKAKSCLPNWKKKLYLEVPAHHKILNETESSQCNKKSIMRLSHYISICMFVISQLKRWSFKCYYIHLLFCNIIVFIFWKKKVSTLISKQLALLSSLFLLSITHPLLTFHGCLQLLSLHSRFKGNEVSIGFMSFVAVSKWKPFVNLK